MNATQRILVVEDEPLIAMMIEDFLDMLGKDHAGTADSVAAALQIVGAGGVDAAILDVNLSGGEQCWPIADALDARGVPFILATGGSGDTVLDAHRDRPVLAKPFTMDSVEQALAAL